MTKIEIVWGSTLDSNHFHWCMLCPDNKLLKSQPTTEESIRIFQSIQKAASQKKLSVFIKQGYVTN
jgi:hypothetical protein